MITIVFLNDLSSCRGGHLRVSMDTEVGVRGTQQGECIAALVTTDEALGVEMERIDTMQRNRTL